MAGTELAAGIGPGQLHSGTQALGGGHPRSALEAACRPPGTPEPEDNPELAETEADLVVVYLRALLGSWALSLLMIPLLCGTGRHITETGTHRSHHVVNRHGCVRVTAWKGRAQCPGRGVGLDDVSGLGRSAGAAAMAADAAA